MQLRKELEEKMKAAAAELSLKRLQNTEILQKALQKLPNSKRLQTAVLNDRDVIASAIEGAVQLYRSFCP